MIVFTEETSAKCNENTNILNIVFLIKERIFILKMEGNETLLQLLYVEEYCRIYLEHSNQNLVHFEDTCTRECAETVWVSRHSNVAKYPGSRHHEHLDQY